MSRTHREQDARRRRVFVVDLVVSRIVERDELASCVLVALALCHNPRSVAIEQAQVDVDAAVLPVVLGYPAAR